VLFWGVISLSAIAGVLTVYPFNAYMARRGFYSSPVQSFAGGEITREENTMVLTSLRNVWGALLLSFALLSGCIVIVFAYL
jgi:hypothetical protein